MWTELEPSDSRGGRPGLPVPNSLYGLCGHKATLNMNLESEFVKTALNNLCKRQTWP